jgi:DNA-binding transcriptional ArsR family regulator
LPSDELNTERVLRSLANDKRLQVLDWLRDPRAHFREQVDGDLVEDGVCGVLIAEKLGVGQPTVSEHMRILVEAGLVRPKRIKKWIFYSRDEAAIEAAKKAIAARL